MRRAIRIALALLAAAALAGFAWFWQTSRPVAVEVAAVEQNVPVEVFGLGTIEARVMSKIGFEVGAALTELKADHGDLVAEGSVLARLHPSEQEAKVEMARAGVLSAKAALRQAEANVARARAVLAQKEAASRRKQELVRGGTVSMETAEESQRDEDVARADLTVAQSSVEVARAGLADARAKYDFERTILDHHTLTAPFDAMVVERHRELGDVVKAGEAIFTLIDPDSVWVLAHVDEARAGHIRLGQAARVRLRSLPEKIFRARVVRIGIESDRVTEERRVYVKCEQCPDRFHLGEQAEVLITVASLDEALLVPEAAVDGFDGVKGRVWTVEDNILRRRAVTFGHRTADARLEIVDGLPPGARVIARTSPSLREGRRAWISGDGE